MEGYPFLKIRAKFVLYENNTNKGRWQRAAHTSTKRPNPGRGEPMTRTGKIARLPRETREKLNRKLRDGRQGGQLIPWLNSLPQVKAVLDKDFEGYPITKQNLSEWRLGGYREWLTQQEIVSRARSLAGDAREIIDAAQGRLSDHLATVLTARYAVALADWTSDSSGQFRRVLRSMRGFCQDVVELRRGDHNAAYLKIEEERMERGREKKPAQGCTCLSEEEKRRRIRQIFGLAPEEPEKSNDFSPPVRHSGRDTARREKNGSYN